MPVVTRQLAFTDCRANSGSILKVRHKLRQTSIGECPSRQSQSVDGILDCRRLSFDFDQNIHPGINLETNCGTADLVLRDVTVDFPGQLHLETKQDLFERVEIL